MSAPTNQTATGTVSIMIASSDSTTAAFVQTGTRTQASHRVFGC